MYKLAEKASQKRRYALSVISDDVGCLFSYERCMCRCVKVGFLALTSFLTFSISKMDDQHVVLLEKLITENMRLGEVIETRDNEQRKMIQELAAKMVSRTWKSEQKKDKEVPYPPAVPGIVFRMFRFRHFETNGFRTWIMITFALLH